MKAPMKLWKLGLLVLLAAYLGVLGGLDWIIRQPPGQLAKLIAAIPTADNPRSMLFQYILPLKPIFYMARGGRLQAGDPAPDFNLQLLHSEERVHLASFQGGKPVVLIFGSYT